MRENRHNFVSKRLVSDFTIWALLLAGVVFMGVCPPIGVALVAIVLCA